MHKYVEDDPNHIINQIVTDLQLAMNEKLEPGDERRIVAEVIGSSISGIKANINATAAKKFLSNMEGDEVDEYGQARGVFRLEPQFARVPVLFTLPSVRAVDSIIPQGTRVTADGKYFFATVKPLTISRGSVSVSDTLLCTTTGDDANGYLVGTIKTITDSLQFACNVTNTDVTSGGAKFESDEAYKERIKQAPAAMTTAGSEDAYEYHARSADSNVIDVRIQSPSGCVIQVIPLYVGGRGPTETEKAVMLAKLTDKRIKPQSDQISVVSPSVLNYTIQLTYYIAALDLSRVSLLKQAIEASVTEYQAWQGSKLDLDINPDQLRFLMMKNGAFKVDITQPTYSISTGGKYAKCTGVTLNYGGVL